MVTITRLRWRVLIPIALMLVALAVSLIVTFASQARFSHAASPNSVTTTQISSDPYKNTDSQHMTELEPDTFAFGKTIVSAFQVGRFYNGGASNAGWATSTDAGKTWTHGFLPATTVNATPPGTYARVSDTSVAFDAKHNVWLISYLGIINPAGPVDVDVSRSTDGGLHWGHPVPVAAMNMFFDKNWTVCDNTASSPFYGHCYTEFDNASKGDLEQMSTSTDGGLTWGAPQHTANNAFGIGGQPLVQPDGRVIVPEVGFVGVPQPGVVTPNAISQPFKLTSFVSTDGGKTWGPATLLSNVSFHIPQGVRATIPLPTAEIDAAGKVYVVWNDCRYEAGCSSNDLLMSTSTDGVKWTQPQLIPVHPVGKGFDHFIPGLAVDPSTSGSSAHLGLAYYFYPTANCQTADCLLSVGYISSTNGGRSWSNPRFVAGPMLLQWLPLTTQGYMVGDYISTSIVAGRAAAYPVFAVAAPPTGSTCIAAGTVCHEAIFTARLASFPITGGNLTAGNPQTYVAPNHPIHVDYTAY